MCALSDWMETLDGEQKLSSLTKGSDYDQGFDVAFLTHISGYVGYVPNLVMIQKSKNVCFNVCFKKGRILVLYSCRPTVCVQVTFAFT